MDFEKRKKIIAEIAQLIEKLPNSLHDKAFDYLIGNYVEKENGSSNEQTDQLPIEVKDNKTKIKKSSSSKKSSSQAQPQLVKDLNLRPSDKKTLNDFFEEKKPKGNIQNSAVMIYYLKQVLQLDEVTPDHVFTCYRELGLKIPAVLNQNLRDCASSRYGYIDFTKNQCNTNIKGINFIEQDLPIVKDK